MPRGKKDEIGRVRYAEVRYASPGRADPSRPWNWWSDAAQGGGVLGAAGSHFVDALRYFVGEILGVQAVLQTFVAERPFGSGKKRVTSDDFAALHLRLPAGALAVLVFSVVAGLDEETMLTLHGEKGAIRLTGEKFLMAKTGGGWSLEHEGTPFDVPGNTAGGPFGSGTVHLGRALAALLDRGDRAALAPAAMFATGRTAGV